MPRAQQGLSPMGRLPYLHQVEVGQQRLQGQRQRCRQRPRAQPMLVLQAFGKTALQKVLGRPAVMPEGWCAA